MSKQMCSRVIAGQRSILSALTLIVLAGSIQLPVCADDKNAGASSSTTSAAATSGSTGTAGSAGTGAAGSSTNSTSTGTGTTSTGTTTGDAAATSGATSSQPIQAGVQLIELNLTMLTHVGLDIKNLLKATDSLYDEVTIQPVSVITEPEVIGRGIIVNIPVGTQPVGPPAPPKKARVDLAMSHMRPVVNTLKADVDEFESGKARLDISDDTRKDLHPYFDDWIKTVNDISANMTKLESVTAGPPYDNSSIAQAVGVVHEDAKRLDEVRRKIYKYLQKEGKQKKKKNA